MSTVIVFPGQGSQKTGMAQDFVEAYPSAKRVFEEASMRSTLTSPGSASRMTIDSI